MTKSWDDGRQHIIFDGKKTREFVNVIIEVGGVRFASVGDESHYCVVTKSRGVERFESEPFNRLDAETRRALIRELEDAECALDEDEEDDEDGEIDWDDDDDDEDDLDDDQVFEELFGGDDEED